MNEQILNPEKSQASGVVDVGSTVELDYGDGDIETVQIVGYHGEGNTGEAPQVASLATPLGSVIVGKEAGDRIVVKAPNGDELYIRIVSVT